MKRKCSLRDSYIRKLRKKGVRHVMRKGKLHRKRPLKKVSRSHRNRLKKYYPIQQEFLAKPENQLCAICIARREHGEIIRQNKATEVHHAAYRYGTLLFDTKYFRPSCRRCRSWPHDNTKKAEEWGLIVRLRN